jgi:hypothetical protein
VNLFHIGKYGRIGCDGLPGGATLTPAILA